jgi:hypothetical protein
MRVGGSGVTVGTVVDGNSTSIAAVGKRETLVGIEVVVGVVVK